MARYTGPKCKLCRREGMKLFLKGERCLTEKCADRAPQLPAGRARPRPHQAVRVPAPAAREAEGAPVLRPAREAVPQLLRQGRRAVGHHRRGAPAHARDAPRQRRLPPRLRRLARAGAPAHPPRPLPGERPAREHPELPGQARRRRRAQARKPGRAGRSRRDRPDRVGRRRGSRPTTTTSRARS